MFIDLVFFIRTHGTHKKEKEKGGRKVEKRTKDEKFIRKKTQLKKISSTFINGTLIFIEEGNGGKKGGEKANKIIWAGE